MLSSIPVGLHVPRCRKAQKISVSVGDISSQAISGSGMEYCSGEYLKFTLIQLGHKFEKKYISVYVSPSMLGMFEWSSAVRALLN